MVADAEGKVLMHSRKAFENTISRDDAMFQGLLWAIQSMKSHRFVNVVFACDNVALVGAIHNQLRWQFINIKYRFWVRNLISFGSGVSRWKAELRLEE